MIFKFIFKNIFLFKDMIINIQFVSFIILNQYGPCKINLKCTYHLHEVVHPKKKTSLTVLTSFFGFHIRNLSFSRTYFAEASVGLRDGTCAQYARRSLKLQETVTSPTASPFL